MKRARSKATTPSAQRLKPIALRATSAARDSEPTSAFFSGSRSAALSAKDVSTGGDHVNRLVTLWCRFVSASRSKKTSKTGSKHAKPRAPG